MISKEEVEDAILHYFSDTDEPFLLERIDKLIERSEIRIRFQV